MQVQMKVQIGQTELIITESAENEIELFQKLSFLSSIPKQGPNGEDDLKLVHRTPQGYDYYSIVSEKAGMEFKFGQVKDKKGKLFPKGWEPLHSARTNSQENGQANEEQTEQVQAGQSVGQTSKTTLNSVLGGTAKNVTTVKPSTLAQNTAVAKSQNPAVGNVLQKYGIK